MDDLLSCTICPRKCAVNRFEKANGYCRSDAGLNVASVCIHKGEEPAVCGMYGICNVFFTGCNLRCLYCQNYQISRSPSRQAHTHTQEELVDSIIKILDKGIEAVGFVSPGHYVPQIRNIINLLHKRGYQPIFVYNSNGYDSVDTLQSLEGFIDVYLPDFKYLDPEVAKKYSDARDYPETVVKAIREMYRQKGSTLVINDNQYAVTGLIIRHLVLPGQSADSIRILEWIADELSVSVAISLMSQYYPTPCVEDYNELNRTITAEEYKSVTDAMERLGFYKGWVQDHESSNHYRPDFNRDHPFEV